MQRMLLLFRIYLQCCFTISTTEYMKWCINQRRVQGRQVLADSTPSPLPPIHITSFASGVWLTFEEMECNFRQKFGWNLFLLTFYAKLYTFVLTSQSIARFEGEGVCVNIDWSNIYNVQYSKIFLLY